MTCIVKYGVVRKFSPKHEQKITFSRFMANPILTKLWNIYLANWGDINRKNPAFFKIVMHTKHKMKQLKTATYKKFLLWEAMLVRETVAVSCIV